jgi:hypothetical protein
LIAAERWLLPLTEGVGDCHYLQAGEPGPPDGGPRLVATVNKI